MYEISATVMDSVPNSSRFFDIVEALHCFYLMLLPVSILDSISGEACKYARLRTQLSSYFWPYLS